MKIFLKIILCSLIIWFFGFCYFVFTIPTNIDLLTKTDAIIVLTGGKGRLNEAFDLINNKMADKMLITGVGKNATFEEIISLSPELSLEKIAHLKDKITLGHDATNTKENASEASLFVSLNHIKTIRLVTSNYHIKRSLLEFSYAMPNVFIIAHPVSNNNIRTKGWWNSPASIMLLLSEYHKYIVVKYLTNSVFNIL